MLEWYPERRASAKDMLNHPWLTMEPDYEFKMTEKESQIMMLKNKLTSPTGEEDNNKAMSELCESEIEMFNADLEDNNDIESDENDEAFFGKNENPESEEEVKLPGPKYLNNSFTGPYPEDMNRPYKDKGPNPQFLDLQEPSKSVATKPSNNNILDELYAVEGKPEK